ncbi:nitroreductase family deazaflavin-dependent oxidoreductase [Microbacterium indicum]|uniref:nitroreductase family deazaflavin-dependent oxidoreductase n=1 Tax=Microbacterium indicum TaxID=358100 RepID=UPI000425ED49|nr:nitroreductase family deazaflavin-dependent oxidoreductase [Microbacterium indicum]
MVSKTAFVPPRFVLTTAWKVHRLIARRGPGRGLWEPGGRETRGAMKTTTTGRRSGEPRDAIVAYFPDGDRVHALAMNGLGEGHPAWWLNLRADLATTVMFADGSSRPMIARRADGDERERLWSAWTADNPDLEGLAARRTTPTDVAVLEPAAA